MKLRPEWHSDDDDSRRDQGGDDRRGRPIRQRWQPHIGKRPKARRELMAKRAKDADDPLKLVIVRDMWLTGFDAPCMHTMYVDKHLDLSAASRLGTHQRPWPTDPSFRKTSRAEIRPSTFRNLGDCRPAASCRGLNL